MWAEYIIRKILSLRGENLKDYFDELNLESVIPKLLQYVGAKVSCDNVVWLMADEFKRLNDARIGGLETLEDGQLMHRHFKVQSIHPIAEEKLLSIVLKYSKENSMPQLCIENNSSMILIPVLHHVTRVPMAYLLVMGVGEPFVERVMLRLSKDISYMAKHIGFSIEHWEAQRMSFLDDLTGLFNQKYMSIVLENEIYRSQREQQKFSVLFMDVDYFKSVNDQRGHWVGSKLLIEVGKIVRDRIRRSDYAFRYGGDEFVIVLPFTPAEKAVIAAERIRSVIEKMEFIIDGEKIKLTLSIGLATYPDHAKTYKDIIKMADEAMYCGKNKSRNIVFVAS